MSNYTCASNVPGDLERGRREITAVAVSRFHEVSSGLKEGEPRDLYQYKTHCTITFKSTILHVGQYLV